MTGPELTAARLELGRRWGFVLTCAELGRALRLAGDDPGKVVSEMEKGRRTISGPVSACIDMWLQGAVPPDGLV